MGGIWTVQSNFTKGEMSPTLLGRSDLAAYYQGVQDATNVLSLPQGGLEKRPGMEFLGEALGDGRLESFSFNVEQNYLLVFSNIRMQIYKDGVLQTNINGSGNAYIVTPWSLAQIADFDYIQSADTIVITHEDVETKIIQRTSDTAWALTAAPFTSIPQIDFNDGSSPTPVSEIQDILFANTANGDTFKISLDGFLTDEIAYSVSSYAATAANIQLALLDLINTGATGVAVVTTGANAYRATFSGDSANDYDLLIVLPVVAASSTFSGATTAVQNGTSRAEDAWSATRGYPRTSTFHESRLWLGGSKSRPATMWGSVANLPFDFDFGLTRDDEAIQITLSTDQINAVEGLVSNRSLQIFTSGAEFYVPESPITPAKVSVKPQTNLGSKRLRPVVLEGATLFVQRTGKALYQFQFINDFQSNESKSVSVLAPHLMNSPVKMSVRRGAATSDANYVYLVGNDGNMSVFSSNLVEGVQSFTEWETQGNIKSVAVVDNEVNLLVEREINSSTVYQIEKENLLLNTDSAVIATVNSDVMTGLGHLEGEAVWAKADGAFQGEFVVSSGSITIPRVAVEIEAGLSFTPTIKTMPFNIALQNGPNAAQKKKIARCALRLFESNGLIVNGERYADKTIGVNQFDAPTPQTGIKRLYLLGWSLDASVTITQTTPFAMTILSIDLEVKV